MTISRIFAHVMRRDLLTLSFYSISDVMRLKSLQNFERNRIIYGWLIDDLERFRREMLGVGMSKLT